MGTTIKAQTQIDTILTNTTGKLNFSVGGYTTNSSDSYHFQIMNYYRTPVQVYDANKRLVASLDTNGILTVVDSLATIKAIFTSYGYKIKGYMQKYYYSYEYYSDDGFIKGMDFMFSTSKPTEKQLKDQVCKLLNKDIDKNRLKVSNLDNMWISNN